MTDCYKFATASTIDIVGRLDDASDAAPTNRDELYWTAVRDFGRVLDRLAAGYESDPEKRRDLRQDIHLQLWRSFAAFDGRCSLKTWALRVAHNTAASYVIRERRINANLAGLDELERTLKSADPPRDIDRDRVLREVQQVILKLRPLDRQIIISYLEGMDAVSIADITGLSRANIAMKIHRIKKILAHGIRKEQSHA
jgi:RNA polymerase sigma-70 factor (ECF subfamily)